MDGLMNFLADNYIYFLIGAGVLLLALIGFIVDGRRKKKNEEVVTAQSINTINTTNAESSIQPEVMQQPNTNLELPTSNETEIKEEPTLSFDAVESQPESIFNIPEASVAPAIGEPIVSQAPEIEKTTAPVQVSEPVSEQVTQPAPEVIINTLEQPTPVQEPSVVSSTPTIENIPTIEEPKIENNINTNNTI